MAQVGILAYGSLIDDPGEEIQQATARRIEGVTTPFNVEFARSSKRRGGAPTLVPVEDGGSEVRSVIFVLKENISLQEVSLPANTLDEALRKLRGSPCN